MDLHKFIIDFKEASLILTEKGKIINCNELFCDLFQIRREDIINIDFFNFFNLLKINTFDIESLLQGKHQQMLYRGDNQLLRTITWNAVSVDENDENLFLLTIVDISALEKKILRTKQIQKSIIDLIPDHNIFWKDKNLVYLGCNQALANSLGLNSPEDIIGKTDYDLPSTKEQSDAYRDDDNYVIKTGKSKLQIEEQQTINGIQRVLLTSKAPLFDEEGNVEGVVAIYSDITERKNMEKDLEKARLAAEAASQAKSEFIANMSHDIRTPLTGMLGLIGGLINFADKIFVALQQTQSGTSEKMLEEYRLMLHGLVDMVREDGQLVLGSADELLQLLNEILGTMSLEAGKVPEQPESFSLRELVEHNVELMHPIARHKQLELHCEIDKNVPSYVKGLHHYLDRTLLNLLSNALKFTEKGFVKISVQILTPHQSSFAIGERVELAIVVEDSGIGIPQDKYETIFEHFSRLTPSYQGIYKGAGLGLYTVKRYIEAMQATIRVESEMGKGTRFIIQLPLTVCDHSDREKVSYRAQTKKKPLPIEPTTLAQQQKKVIAITNPDATARILIVEDNHIAAKAARGTIQEHYSHCDCDIAGTGKDAIHMAQTNAYDFILMDIGLPDIDGIEVTRQIRALHSPEQASVPIVALTGHGSNWEKKEEALAAGMQEVLEKPLTEVKLDLVMQRYVFPLGQNEQLTQGSQLKGVTIPSDKSVVDWEQCIQNFSGDEAIVSELLTDLARDLKLTQEKVAELYAANDEDGLRAELHRVNGGMAYFSLPQLSKTREDFHQAVKEKPQQAKKLEKTYTAFQEAIDAFLTTMHGMGLMKSN